MYNPTQELVPASSVQDENFSLNSTSISADCGDTLNSVAIPDFSSREPGWEDDAPAGRTIEPADWSSKYCCPRSTVMEAYCQEGMRWHAIQGRCNAWDCPGCGPLRTWKLCKRIETARPNRLVTLTCGSPGGRSPAEVWDDTRRMVPELIRLIRSHHGETEYCRVMELHKSGFPHFHLVVRSPFIPQADLSRYWCKLTGAYIVDVRAIQNRDVARYVAKYLGKQTRVPAFTSRRVTASRGFFDAPLTRQPSTLNLCDIRREGTVLRSWLDYHWPDKPHSLVSPFHAVEEPTDDRWSIEDDEIGSGS